jgi:hypothetical protein
MVKHLLYKVKGCCPSGYLNLIRHWKFVPDAAYGGSVISKIWNVSFQGNSLDYVMIRADEELVDSCGKLRGDLTFGVECWTPCAYQRSFMGQPLDIVQVGGFAATVISKQKHQLGGLSNPARGNYHSWKFNSRTYLTNTVGVDVPLGTKLKFQIVGGWGNVRYVWLSHRKSLGLHFKDDFNAPTRRANTFDPDLGEDGIHLTTDDKGNAHKARGSAWYPSSPENPSYSSLTLVENGNYAPELTTIAPDMLSGPWGRSLGYVVDRPWASPLSKSERDRITNWKSDVQYVPGDLVTKAGVIFRCQTESLDRNPLEFNREAQGGYNSGFTDDWVKIDNQYNTPHAFTVHAKDLGATSMYIMDSAGCVTQYVLNVVASHCTKWTTEEGASCNNDTYTIGTRRLNLPERRVSPLTQMTPGATPLAATQGFYFHRNGFTLQAQWRWAALDHTNVVPINEDWEVAKYYYDNGQSQTQSQWYSWCDCNYTGATTTFFEDGADPNHPHSLATFQETNHVFFNGWGHYSSSGNQNARLVENAIPEVYNQERFTYCDRWRNRNESVRQYETTPANLGLGDKVELPVYTPRCLTDSHGIVDAATDDEPDPAGFFPEQFGDPTVLYAGFERENEFKLPPWFLYNDVGEKVDWDVEVVERKDADIDSAMGPRSGAGWSTTTDGELHTGPWTLKKNQDRHIIKVKKNHDRTGFKIEAQGVTNYLPAMIRIRRSIPKTSGISSKGNIYTMFPMAGPMGPREVVVQNDDPALGQNLIGDSALLDGSSPQGTRPLLVRHLFYGGRTSLSTRRIPIDGTIAEDPFNPGGSDCVPWTQSDLFARVMVLAPAVSVGVANSNLDGSKFMAKAGTDVSGPDSQNKHQTYPRQAIPNRDVYSKFFSPNFPPGEEVPRRAALTVGAFSDAIPERTIIDFGPRAQGVPRKFRIYFNMHPGNSPVLRNGPLQGVHVAGRAKNLPMDIAGLPYVYIAAYPIDQTANSTVLNVRPGPGGQGATNFLKDPGHRVPKRVGQSNTFYVELELNDTKNITTALGFMQIFISFKPDIKSRIINNHPYLNKTDKSEMKLADPKPNEPEWWFFSQSIANVPVANRVPDRASWLPAHHTNDPKGFCDDDYHSQNWVNQQGGLYTQLRGVIPILPAFIEYQQHNPLLFNPDNETPAILRWGRNGNLQQRIFAANALGRFGPMAPPNPQHPFMFNTLFAIRAGGARFWFAGGANPAYRVMTGNDDPFWGGLGANPQA